ncbi:MULTISPECIES: SgcJ/EcaC family oxidoreductase [unclassified Mesorhizobium]|uniref:SgcJ/EcaC family oxidoreductase n=1 Tax=unclassified Mesorhizobium TaxID=325217 RepID=UPI0025753A44|nr:MULTISPECIES: SgcJ/EcaC family oxidoreductase [unclassified Mesorhizobium]WJI80824.1 SgcJ/EcaC family oxidoreductase [Mesorhizobium sp. C374B]WJI87363.1 SgcJ/EcaC family oxidoreductase [Mesorhizobium sp. C372A]
MFTNLDPSTIDADRVAVTQLVKGFDTAWNRHDMQAFGTLFADDAEFVNVVGMWWRGRNAIQAAHAHTHATFLKNSVLVWDIASLRFLGAEVALVHVRWRMTGHLDPSGAIGAPRQGILSLVTVKSPAGWRIAAVQNTNEVSEAEARMPRA